MKSFNTIYYLLFVLIVFGAFASMAQNDYGLSILGVVAFLFSVLFIVQLVGHLTDDESKSSIWIMMELLGLVIVSLILGMRVYYFRFPFVEGVFAAGGLLIAVSYAHKAYTNFSKLRKSNSRLAIIITLVFASLFFYTVSMTAFPLAPPVAQPAGIVAFTLLIIFAVITLARREFMIGGEKISPLTYLLRLRDRTILLISLFLAFTLYMGLTTLDLLPQMYSDQFPRAYYELVNRAESGAEKAEDGTYRHEEFKRMYDKFVERHTEKDSD